jgi:crotonobetainyl-CoA:carnitine CoA-transferase CaiB-like acyl-CoA transferase
VRRLARSADVLVENYRPGKLESWGLGYERLTEVNPRLVVLHISGYGRSGPYRDRPGFGTLAEAFSGFAYTNGHPDGPPTLPAFPIADTVAGLVGCYTVLAALRERDASGRGQEVELDLYESLLALMGNMVMDYDQLGVVMERRGNRSKTSVPRNAYPTRDGRWVVLSSTTDAMAARVFRAIGRDDLANDPSLASNVQRARRVDEIDGAVAAWVAQRTQAEALERLQAFDVPAGPINDVAQFVADPHVQARGTLTTLEDEELGTLRMPGVVPRFGRTPGRVRWAGRAQVGADTRDIVRGAGYSDEEIDGLARAGVIRMA